MESNVRYDRSDGFMNFLSKWFCYVFLGGQNFDCNQSKVEII